MHKKRLLAVVMAIFVISGCDNSSEIEPPKFSFSNYDELSQSSSTESSSVESSSIESTSTESSSVQSSSTASSSAQSSSTASSSVKSSSTASSSTQSSQQGSSSTQNENSVYKIILDPLNEKTVTINGNEITVTGTTEGGFQPSCSFSVSHTITRKNGRFTYTAKVNQLFTGYGSVQICWSGSVRVYAEKGQIRFVECTDVEQENTKAVEKTLDQPLNQVAEYIAVNADKEKLKEVMAKITEISNKICDGISSDYDKLRAISRWVSENIYYDFKAFDDGVPAETLTLEYMLNNSSSVCGGYSNMTSALAAVQGIKVCNVHGSAVNNSMTFDERQAEYHEWNYAVIDGRVIWVDSGWNSYCYRYSNGKYESGKAGVKYFDISPKALAQNHKAKYAEYRDYFAAIEQ